MKKILLISFALASSLLFGFDIQPVDLTEKGKEKSALPYTMAEDGKKIYNDIGKTIEALNGQIVMAMDVEIIYPMDSNKTHEPSSLSKKKKKTENIGSVFTDINANEESKLEDINNENKQIKLNKKAKKLTPVNLEK